MLQDLDDDYGRCEDRHATAEATGLMEEQLMPIKDTFSADEWNTLHRGITGAGMLVSASEVGFSSTFKETGAMAKVIAGARASSPSELVRELASESGTGWALGTKPDELRTEVIVELSASNALLTTKAPHEVEAYRAFVLEVSSTVAAAAKGGEQAEAASIAAITQALGA
jgi:hypothetical protein